LQVRRAENTDASIWDAYVSGSPEGLAYQLFAWKQATEAAYGFDCPYFIAEEKNRICGVLPTVHVHLPFKKGQLVSLPYCDAGGILADRPEIASALFNHACEYARKHEISKLEIRQPPPLPVPGNPDQSGAGEGNSGHADPAPQPPEKVRMLLELPESSDALLSGFKSKLRSQVKRPARDGLAARLGGVELLNDFFPVFAENMRDLGSPVHCKDWLGRVLKAYGENARCGVVYMPDRTAAAAGIILCHNRIVSIPWASSRQRFNRFSPNMLLYWTFLRYAADCGYRFFDFGRSTPGEGTYRFKAQWGATSQPLHWQQWMANGKTGFRPATAGFTVSPGRTREILEQIIRKTPLPVATLVGSRLRKYITL